MKLEFEDQIFVFCLVLLLLIVGSVTVAIAELTPQKTTQSFSDEQKLSDEEWAAIWVAQQQLIPQQLRP